MLHLACERRSSWNTLILPDVLRRLTVDVKEVLSWYPALQVDDLVLRILRRGEPVQGR